MSLIKESYELLGLQLNASPEAIKHAYRNLVKVWHPDRFPHNSEAQKAAAEKFKDILQAYEVLKDYQPGSSSDTSEAVGISKTEPTVYYHQGAIYAEQEKYQEAIAEFSQAIFLDPNYIKAYQYRAFILSKLGYENRANADFQKVATLKVQKSVTTPTSEPPKPKSPPQTLDVSSISPQWFSTNKLIGHSQAVTTLAISQDGKVIASGSSDQTIKLWQLRTAQIITTIRDQHKASINCIVFSRDRKKIFSGSAAQTIHIWNWESKQSSYLGNYKTKHREQFLAIAISPDGKKLISSSADKTIKAWNVTNGELIYNLTSSLREISCLAMSPDGETFVTGGQEPHLRIRKTESGQIVRSIKGNSGVLSVVFSPDGNLIATGGYDRTVRVWNVNTAKEIAILQGHSDRVSCIQFSSDGRTLFSGSWDQSVKIWSLESYQEINTLKGHTGQILAMAITPDDKTLSCALSNGIIQIWSYL